ncbi:uncharacterized protein LOC107040799 [Diachasma alloeum]|uniref:uncharacterized protein LOC107040799 n=1 Tax=Diachasma alloeum TaxID=454923 RepID=UPI000738436B|nr:uncharacterized protein LOC107040799 [Diachasma alloeum]
MSKPMMLTTILLLAALTPITLSTSAADPLSNNETSLPGILGATPDGSQNQREVPAASIPPAARYAILQVLNQTKDILSQMLDVVGRLLSRLIYPLPIILKDLLAPIIFLLKAALLLVRNIVHVLLEEVFRDVISPALKAIGRDDINLALTDVSDAADNLTSKVLCLLGRLLNSYGVNSDCDDSKPRALDSADILKFFDNNYSSL